MANKREASGGTPDASVANKVLAVKTPGGKVYRLESDFDFGRLVDIAAANDTNWAAVVANPLFAGSGQVALDLFRAACDLAGEAVPDPLNAKAVYDAFQAVDDESPTYHEDGRPTAGDQETT